MSTNPRSLWLFWLLWTLATAFSIMVQTLMSGWGWGSGPLLLALTQWWILRAYIPRAGGWLLATIVGGAIAVAGVGLTGLWVSGILAWGAGPLAGAVGGLVIGMAQWFVIRPYVPLRWWLLANVLALACGIGWFFPIALQSAFIGSNQGWLYWAALGAASGAIGGAIKGGVLAWWLNRYFAALRDSDLDGPA